MKTLICAILFLSIGFCASATWSDIPKNLYCSLLLTDYSGDAEIGVLAGPWTMEFVTAFYKGTSGEANAASIYQLLLPICAQKFGDDRFLYMRIMPMSGHEGICYWYPWNLALVQGSHQFSVTTSDLIAGFTDLFSGRVYVQMDGFIRVPDWIDYSRPFDIWYGDKKTTLGPIAP